MTDPLNYPLEELMSIKKTRFDQAVKVLEEKKALLEKAYEKLYSLTRERDEALEHKTAKLTQLRQALDEGQSSGKIQQMKIYLTLVEEKLAEKEKKVVAQQKEVDLAQQQVDAATAELFQRKKDLEKLELHKEEWLKEVRFWTLRKEANEQDEQGSAVHEMLKRETKKRRKDYEH